MSKHEMLNQIRAARESIQIANREAVERDDPVARRLAEGLTDLCKIVEELVKQA